MTAKVEIYTWSTCPFCNRAKNLLLNKGVDFIEYNIDRNEVARNEMAQRANGKRSLPQIFINDHHIGGCDNLYTLDSAGQLDTLLGGSKV
ncbi:glutaredoxin 3 [Sphaerospermopsis sp. LEGE 00249]|uniref:glutaredoxin 3 n=1 Tax=Sphaerospermopsis sp. LEGE 00249 TaxID=1380707 RepID=UPI00164D3CCF|nr:glutaredoxin 3 [Sphaerospermopsis sp. LEGE 00249]MBC5795373.1 glutaredoxin 3 [Sphaerospermopsis sp. LEGE 00249]